MTQPSVVAPGGVGQVSNSEAAGVDAPHFGAAPPMSASRAYAAYTTRVPGAFGSAGQFGLRVSPSRPRSQKS